MNRGADTLVVTLDQLAHGRTGDKGNRSNISVIAWREEFWPVLVAQVTEDKVAQLFALRHPSRVQRFLLPPASVPSRFDMWQPAAIGETV